MRIAATVVFACASSGACIACDKSTGEKLAPAASALGSAAPAPASKGVRTFVIERGTSALEFVMNAELEVITGRAPAAARGELFVDPKDLSKTSGLVKIDLDALSIYKKVRDEPGDAFGAEEKSEKQNADMRNWFQIGKDAPQGDREKYRWAEFKIHRVQASPNDVTSLSGPRRSVGAHVTGDFRLHGRVSQKTIVADLVFTFDGDRPTAVTLRSKQPFEVGLEEHDVRPRKSFAQLADVTLEALGHKVAKVARVSVEATATAR